MGRQKKFITSVSPKLFARLQSPVILSMGDDDLKLSLHNKESWLDSLSCALRDNNWADPLFKLDCYLEIPRSREDKTYVYTTPVKP